MAKKRKNTRRRVEEVTKEKRALNKRDLGKLLLLVLVVAVIFGFYRVSLSFSFFKVVLWVYLAALPTFILAYYISSVTPLTDIPLLYM